MHRRDSIRNWPTRVGVYSMAGLIACLCLAFLVAAKDVERTAVNVFVKEAESDEPIMNARLTLQYNEGGGKLKLKRGKNVSLYAKTNPQGRYKFTNIPKGTVRLMVIADHHQTYGQEVEIDQDNQLIEVKLRKPQPLL